MAMIDVLKQRLVEAEEAYHKLMIGEKEVSVSVGNFGSTSYNQTNISQLEKYISALKTQINKVEGRASRRVIKVVF
ncbi:MAG: hypothetical protein IJX20_00110 [Alphaproteobacteria bacterium]|nr:hypothetical protein [Alphaproteobacteria bacterium]